MIKLPFDGSWLYILIMSAECKQICNHKLPNRVRNDHIFFFTTHTFSKANHHAMPHTQIQYTTYLMHPFFSHELWHLSMDLIELIFFQPHPFLHHNDLYRSWFIYTIISFSIYYPYTTYCRWCPLANGETFQQQQQQNFHADWWFYAHGNNHVLHPHLFSPPTSPWEVTTSTEPIQLQWL